MHNPAATGSLENSTVSLKQADMIVGGSAPTAPETLSTAAGTVGAERLGVYDSFDALPESYASLFDAAGRQSYFFSRSWFENLAKTTFKPHEQVRIFGLETEGAEATPLACLVLRTPAGQKGSIFSGLFFPPASLAGLTTHPTTLYSPLVAETVSDPKAALSRLLGRILGSGPACPILDLHKLDPQGPLFTPLVEALRDQGICVRPYYYCYAPYEPVAGLTFEDYLKDRPRDVRTEPRRRLRKLEKDHDIVFRILTDPADMDEAIETFERVNGASWREPEPFPDFDGGLLRAAAADGVLRFGLMTIDGEAAAVQIWLVAGGSATMFKIAFDEKFKKLHVGTLLMRHVIGHVIDTEPVDELDFGLYDTPYKLRWLARRREIWGIVSFNPRTVAGLAALLRFDAEQALSRVKKICKGPVLAALDTVRRLKPKKA